jgi:hypothetical protein
MSLIRTVYVSAAVKPFTQPELRELLSKARAYNSSVGITGLLLYHKESFFQILEGKESDVTSLFASIERDKRHNRVLLLSKTNTEERNFGAWSMGFIDVDPIAAKLPGFMKLLDAKSSFLDLRGNSGLTAKLIDGFQDGRWRQSIEK